MSKEMSIILLGVLNIVIATNLLGVPTSWRNVLLIVSGVTITTLGLLLRGETLGRNRSGKHSFVENSPTPVRHEENNA